MGRKTSISLALTIFVIVTALELVLTVPVSIPANGRALRSVSLHRHNSNDENPVANLLLSQQQPAKSENATAEHIFVQRDNISGEVTTTFTGDGLQLVEGEGGNGTFSNDTIVGSRFKQNETDPCSLDSSVLCSDPTHPNRSMFCDDETYGRDILKAHLKEHFVGRSTRKYHDRDKQRRIAHIVNYLWTNLFGNRTRPVSKEMMRTPVNPSSSSFSGGLESISASCDLPPEVDSEAWSSRRHFSLYFNLTSKYPDVLGFIQNSQNSSSESATRQQQQPQQQSVESGQSHEYQSVLGTKPLLSSFTITPNKAVNIISAKLRLYKAGTSDFNTDVFATTKSTEPYNDTTAFGLEEEMPSVLPTRVTFPEFSPTATEKIRVSVFWYTQAATRNHYKKKLLDTKMLSVKESSWVEFDIKNAAAAWLNDRRPNYGLVIEVENENQDTLDPANYFRSVPCFKSESEGEIENDDEGQINRTMSPVIEICTLNVPEATPNSENPMLFPNSMNMNSFNHLQRIAESHRSSNATRSPHTGVRYPWQNFNPRVNSVHDPDSTNGRSQQSKPTTAVPNHRHRHHHHNHFISQNNNSQNEDGPGHNQHLSSPNQSIRNRSRFTNAREFTLDEDHPLREILATVNGNSREANKQGQSTTATISTHQFGEPFMKGFTSQLTPEMPADEGRVDDYGDSTEHDRDVFITKIILTPDQLKESGLSGILSGRGLFPLVTTSTSAPPTNLGNFPGQGR